MFKVLGFGVRWVLLETIASGFRGFLTRLQAKHCLGSARASIICVSDFTSCFRGLCFSCRVLRGVSRIFFWGARWLYLSGFRAVGLRV